MREDWIECTLDEVCNIYAGVGFPKNKQGKVKGDFPFYKVGDISKNVKVGNRYLELCDNYIDKGDIAKIENKLLPPKSIAFAKIGEALKLNRRCITTDYCLVDNNAIGIKANASLTDLFLYFFFLTIQLEKYSRATTVPSVRKSDIESIKLPLPPLPIQKAIVKKLEELFSSLDSGIADLKKAQDQLVIYRQAVLKKAFEGELTKDWREKNPYSMDSFLNKLKEEKANAVKSKLIQKSDYFPIFQEKELTYKIPENWVSLPWKTTTSNNKYAMKRGPFGSALKKAFFVEKGIVVYEQGHAINDEPFRHRYFITPKKFDELKAFKTKGGDMIISCSGATLGRICLLPENADIGVINQALLKIDLDEKILFKKFFIMMFRSETFQRLIFAKSLGTAMPNMIGMKELKEIPIPIPSIEEQKQIILEVESRLSVCDKVEESIKESLQKAQALRQSILKKAFEGTLLSEQEITACKAHPEYEPAGVLLGRIKEEKRK